MLHQYRNNPCVVMWSIGNEVPTQCSPEGYKVASFLQDICHREDPTRPVTCGMDQVTCVLANGFAAMIDVPGLNYRAHRYVESYETLPQNIVLGSETASTVSSRGVYKFPVQKGASVMYDDHQCSGYDVECCSWSNLPDEDFALADDYDWTIGQFVWTGFDYLGEPSPYSTDSWPSHSSVFGIISVRQPMEQAGKYLACPSALDVAGQGKGEYSGFCLHQLSQCRTVRQRKELWQTTETYC